MATIEGVVCICSRGLVHSRTLEAVERELQGRRHLWAIEYTHDMEIPRAQNYVTDRALARDPLWVWYVEEDVVVPPQTLFSLMMSGQEFPVVVADYALGVNGSRALQLQPDGSVKFAGMGCLLVSAEVLRKLPKPIFKNKAYRYYGDGTFAPIGFEKSYGGQDIHLFAELHKLKVPIGISGITCLHLMVEEYGAAGTNSGCHRIVAR